MAIDYERIQKSIRKLKKFVKQSPKQPSPEEIHTLRTNGRKLEAMLSALALDSQRNERRLLQAVRKVRKRAGKVRDLDVLTGHLAGLRIDGETECQVQLLEHLGADRSQQVKKLRALINNQSTELTGRLREASKEVDIFLADDPDAAQDAASQAAAQALKLSSELHMPKRFNRGNLHPYRLKVKELRYVLQLGQSSEDHSSDAKFIEELGKVKDAIGEWHDWEELIGIAQDVLDHPGCNLLRKLKTISDSKYEEAARFAENLRKQHLRASTRKRSRKKQAVAIEAPVLASTLALSSPTDRRAA